MPIYQVVAPDGRQIELEGDTPPTDQDLDGIFAGLEQPKPVASQAENPMPSVFRRNRDPRTGLPSDINPAYLRGNLQAAKGVALEGGGAAGGQALGMATGPFAGVAVPVFGALGGFIGNSLQQITDDRPGFRFGEALAAGVAGAVPGASLAGAGAKTVVKEGLKAGATNVAATATESLVDEGKLPSGKRATVSLVFGAGSPLVGKVIGKNDTAASQLTAEYLDSAVKRKTLQDFQAAGGVVPPWSVKDEGLGLSGRIAGIQGVNQSMSRKNQPVVNALARESLGLPGQGKVTLEILEDVRARGAAPYKEVAAISDEASAALKELRQARINSQEAADAWKASRGSPEAHAAWAEAKAQAEALEDAVAGFAEQAGKPDLVKRLQKSRKIIARTYDLQPAIRHGSGDIEAGVLAAAFDGRNMTEQLATIARAADAFGPYMRVPSDLSYGGGGRLDALAMGQALATQTPTGIMAAGVPFLARPMQRHLMSPRVQRTIAEAPITPPDPLSFGQNAARLTAMSLGRQ